MSVLNVVGLRKILGAQEILRGVDLRVERGEKVGCVGRNGEGKTTLLRLIEGEMAPDGGTVQLTRGARMGYVKQRPDFAPGVLVRGYVEAGLAEVHRVERELERVHHELAEAQGDALEAALRRQAELTSRMELLGGWEVERRVETVLSGIGLAPSLWDREARTLSGGEKSRAAMARELVSVPDLLLLDEPTNHLDLAGIEWLEDWLRTMSSAVILVSHDRRLLERVVDAIVEVERGRLVRYPGNYSKYIALKEERFLSELRAWEQQQEQIKKEEAFIKKHMGSQRTGEAKGRRKRLQGLERLPRPYDDVRRPRIRVARAERGGEQVLEARGLAVGHGGKPLLEGVELRIGRGERIGLVGPNGAGKTTLIQALAGRREPLAGTIAHGYRSRCGYYDQETRDLVEDSTPYLEIRRGHPESTDEEIRSHLARFLFRGGDVDLSVRSLSGGERARLALAKLVLGEPSWLALDEPTNHLDLAGRTALEEMLSEFPGAIVVITHDRQFLDDLANRIVEVKDGRVRAFRGNYSDYRKELAAEEEERAGRAAARAGREREEERARERARERSAERGKKGSKRKPPAGKGSGAAPESGKPGKRRDGKSRNPWRRERVEEEIIALEKERDALLESLGREEVYRDGDASREAQMRLAEIERDLQEKNLEWESFI